MISKYIHPKNHQTLVGKTLTWKSGCNNCSKYGNPPRAVMYIYGIPVKKFGNTEVFKIPLEEELDNVEEIIFDRFGLCFFGTN